MIAVPYPPSVNRIWRNVRGKTLKSAEYRAWLAEALVALRAQHAPAVKGSYSLAIVADRPDRRQRDLGNLEKAISDLLVHAGVIEDDHLAKSIIMAWSDKAPTKGANVQISVVAA